MKIPQETAFVKPFLRMILKIVHSAAFPAPGFGICAQNDRPRGGRAAGREEKNLRICAGRAHDRCRGGHAATDEMSWDMRCTTGGAEETMTFPPHPLRCAQHPLGKEKAAPKAMHDLTQGGRCPLGLSRFPTSLPVVCCAFGALHYVNYKST